MKEEEIFSFLFEIAKNSKDPRGIVAACLVDNDEIVAASPSADDGIRHAEDLVVEKLKKKKEDISGSAVLYCTLEPCNFRTNKSITDCATLIINSGIKNVVFGANDPDYGTGTNKRLKESGISVRQTNNLKIIRKCAEIFNKSAIHDDVKSKPELPK